MNSALKELFNAYKYLPVGVMFFKDEKLFFINNHLRTVLLLASLPTNHTIEIISSMLGLEESSHRSLHNFLLHHDLFTYKNTIIQIEHKSVDAIDLFVLVKISDKTIEAIDVLQPLRSHKDDNRHSRPPLINEEWRLLTKALGSGFETRKFPSVVLYKEIPIKADCRIAHFHKKSIEIRVAKRQLIATEIGQEWLLGNKNDTMLSGKVLDYDLLLGTVRLENLAIVSEGFHLRNDIRYTIEKPAYFSTAIKKETITLQLHDLSEKGVSVQTDDPTVLSALSSMIGKTLNAEVKVDDVTIAIKAVPLYLTAIANTGVMKVAFRTAYDLHNEMLLHTWTNNEQLNLIKKVRNFVQMISAKPADRDRSVII